MLKRFATPRCLLLLLLAAPAAASDGVLVPVFYGDPGAYGSVWRTRLTIFNDSDEPLQGITFNYYCGIPEGCHAPLPAKSSITFVASNGFRYTTGFLLYPGIERPEVSYALRVFDERRGDATYGTDVPVVPLQSFSEKKLHLLDVPTDRAFRVMLRIYAVPPATPRVRVKVFQDAAVTSASSPAAPRLLRDHFYELAVSPFGPSTGSFSRPSAVVVSDLLDGLPTPVPGSVRLEIQSATPGIPIWAFASVTNNTTQAVTVVVPRSIH